MTHLEIVLRLEVHELPGIFNAYTLTDTNDGHRFIVVPSGFTDYEQLKLKIESHFAGCFPLEH